MPTDCQNALSAALAERILVLDGAMGTQIQQHQLAEADYRGERFADWPQDLRGNNDLLTLTQPDLIREIHQAYLAAGAEHALRRGERRLIVGVEPSSGRAVLRLFCLL